MSISRLSQHFTFDEMTFSQEAARRGIDNTPNVFHVACLIRLCKTVLEPVRVKIDAPLIPSSGYRCRTVNVIVGGSDDSDHMYGCAGDVHTDAMRPVDLFSLIREMGLPFDQLILEYGRWVHVSVPRKAGAEPRRECWIYTRTGGGRTHKERV